MSQRSLEINKEIDINLHLTITLKSISNHDGFTNSQVNNAIEEFQEKIQNEILQKITKEYQQEEFLNTVDFVNYNIEEFKELEVPPVLVRCYGEFIDDISDGVIYDVDDDNYVMLEGNHEITKWPKEVCDIIG